jgi:hypothetical protein
MNKFSARIALRLFGLAAFTFSALSTLGASNPWTY